jgi:hypothetical protein
MNKKVGRPRTPIPPEVDAEIKKLYRAGTPVESIYETLRTSGITVVGKRTLFRRIEEFKTRGDSSPSLDPAQPATMPADESEIPTEASLELLDKWINDANEQWRIAKTAGHIDSMGKIGRLVAAFVKQKEDLVRRSKDTGEKPDMILLGEQVQKRLTKMVQDFCGVAA